MEIAGKVAIITGGASGLGEATVRRLAGMGARVGILDMNEERGRALVAELGESVSFHRADVCAEEPVQQAIDGLLARHGALHVCCNYAGTGNAIRTLGRDGPFPLAEFERVVRINLIGTFNVLRLAAQQMARNEPLDADGARGVIINTASVAAYEGQIGQAAYSASKGGVVGMTLPVARDLAQYGIRVNTIVPGLIDTPLFQGLPEPAITALGRQVLFPQRLGAADEIARLAVAIIENDYLNGECIRLDGGIRMQPR